MIKHPGQKGRVRWAQSLLMTNIYLDNGERGSGVGESY
jgi:hypothetical protein